MRSAPIRPTITPCPARTLGARAARAAALLLALAPAAAQETVTPFEPRIMPLGDSITESISGQSSYRAWLWSQLVASGHCVDFVGTRRGVLGGTPRQDGFDQDHEGHTGAFADFLLSSIDAWLHDAQPDVVLLHTGTNDLLLQRQDPGAVAAEIDAIVDAVFVRRPGAAVVVAQVIPSNFLIDTESLNKEIARHVAHRRAAGQRVLTVDLTEGFDTARHLRDPIHPNDAGERLMAERWFAALRTVLEPCRASYTSFGRGCGDAAFRIEARGGIAPRTGRTFVADVKGLPADTTLAYGLLGVDERSWLGSALPFDLAFAGAPGCALWIAPLDVIPLRAADGAATWPTRIPDRTDLAGARFYQQVLVVDASANALGLRLSHAAGGFVGVR